ncbi:MAG: hypothetical protein KDA45_13755 [Planctomycetales bacterium]|nr:hypothetical protein [Planctomycetales bacterium]
MNYLAHAYLHLDDPYFAAGTALPDWMSFLDRKNRPRRQYALPVTEHPNPQVAAFAQGCVRHHDDDRWFHQTESFVTLSTAFAVELREILQPGMGHQAGFVGHISVELLLDAILCERQPSLLSRYYGLLDSLDALLVQSAANEICPRPVDQLASWIPRFVEVQFLASYQQDERLLESLNRVMRRIGLPPLPPQVASWLASARTRVRDTADQLLTPSLP